jgi:pimeloyl-ACP methyl ester carboxylesterase
MADTQATLVFVPGLLCDAVVWETAVERLGRHLPCSVAVLDTQDTITAMAKDTLAAHPGPLFVAGHSMGARVAMEMWRLAPARVTRLALLDTGVHPFVDGEQVKRLERVKLAYAQGMRALADDWLPAMVHPDRHADAALMGTLTAMIERNTPEVHERQIQALMSRPDARPLLPQIRCPTLLLVGRQDQWSPIAQHEEMLGLLPNARLVVIEHAAHFAPVERPAEVTAALESWALTD